jgi:hypothetical protein
MTYVMTLLRKLTNSKYLYMLLTRHKLRCTQVDNRYGTLIQIFVYCAKGRRFVSRTLRTFKMHGHTYILTYHSRFIPDRVAEASQNFLQELQVLPKLEL